MKSFTIRKSLVKDAPGYWEFDFNLDGKRVRRKMQCTGYQSDLLCNLIKFVVESEFNREDAISLVDGNGIFYSERDFLIKGLDFLLYNSQPSDSLSLSDIRQEYMDSFFPPLETDVTICLLGKAGVGKSSIIQKMNPFFGTDMKFPFTDMSRTTTFSADYRFISNASEYKLVVALRPFEEIAYNFYECIDRAVSKYFEQKLYGVDDDTLYNEVLGSFTNDPNNTFDARFSLGKFLRTSSPNFNSSAYADMHGFWADIFGLIKKMCEYVFATSAPAERGNASFYNFVFASNVRSESKDNEVYKLYQSLIDTIRWKMEKNEKEIKKSISAGASYRDLKIEEDGHSCLSCYITDMTSDDTQKLLQTLTYKKATYFGKSLLNKVEYLKIELPYNQNIVLPKPNLSIVMRDTVGVAHNPNETGGFEDSTNLNMEHVDVVLLVDDSRMNGDNNFTTLLTHILARIDASKIFYAYTFYDDFNKADFDDDDDPDIQKIEYLCSVTKNAINQAMSGNLFDEKKFNILTCKLNSKDSFFLKGLMQLDAFDSINHMIDVLAKYKLTANSDLHIYKINDNEPLLVYDYKKIPLLYGQAIENFYNSQADIYEKNPPHYKTTEALTRRLSFGISYFIGAKTLRPVDDFYDYLIQSLSVFLNKPQKLNYNSLESERLIDTTEQLLGDIRTFVTEVLRKNVNARFLSKKAMEKWSELYQLTGIGSDSHRREGIINEEHHIGSSVDEYINSSDDSHIINTIESAIRDAVSQAESKYTH